MSKKISVDFLKDVDVLLVGNYIPCPFAAYLLKNLGANIIKVEPPFGDLMRELPPLLKSIDGTKKISAGFRAFNGGFKSIVIDLKKENGKEIFVKLVEKSHIILNGNRPGYFEDSLGIDVEKINSDIVHVPVTAYGLKGPMRDMAGHDNNILAMLGLLSFTSPAGASIFGAQVADVMAGFLAAFIAVSALFGKKNPNSKTVVNTFDSSMTHAASALLKMYLTGYSATRKSPIPNEEMLNGALPNYNMYKTKDNKSVFLGCLEKKLFANFCTQIKRDDLLALMDCDDETNGTDKLKLELQEIFSTKTAQDWIDELKEVDCCFTPVNSVEDVTKNRHFEDLGLIFENNDDDFGKLFLSGYPVGFNKSSDQLVGLGEKAPEIGEHTEEILKKFRIQERE